jgi:hypothetical protein
MIRKTNHLQHFGRLVSMNWDLNMPWSMQRMACSFWMNRRFASYNWNYGTPQGIYFKS